jgi:hypothetical protein
MHIPEWAAARREPDGRGLQWEHLLGGRRQYRRNSSSGDFDFNFCPSAVTAWNVCFDGLVMKLDPTGNKILYATYINGGGAGDVRTSYLIALAV